MSQLISIDYSGIEAVLTGWFTRDPSYIRLARLGVHAYLASHLLGRPADLAWNDLDLISYFSQIKEDEPEIYDQAKRTVHGRNYRLTAFGMAERWPELFPTKSAAQRILDLYAKICPALLTWQDAGIRFAWKNHYWGGTGEPGALGVHPYGYKHYFYDVVGYKPVSDAAALRLERERRPMARIGGRAFELREGKDANRVVAFGPQSTAAGVIKEAGIRLFAPPEVSGFGSNWIGELGPGGRTPLRALVHDEYLMEVPDSRVDRVVECAVKEMRRPVAALPCPESWGMGTHLSLGVEVRVGRCWSKKKMAKVDISGIEVPGSPWAEHRAEMEDPAELELRQEFGVDLGDEGEAPEDEALRVALAG